jgi:MFS family permease
MYNIWILGLASFFTDISTEMVYPLLGLYLSTYLGAGPAILGLIEGVAESLASLLKLFSGQLSDKIGRRKPLAIGGYAASTLGKILLFFSASWLWVFWGRVADRFGKGIRTAPRDALISQSVPAGKQGFAFGLHRSLDTAGAVIGVVFAYYFVVSFAGNLQAVFLWSLVPAALGIAVLFMVKETTVSSPSIRAGWTLGWRDLDPKLRAFLITIFLFTLANSSNQFLLLRAQNQGFAPKDVILLYLAYNVVYSLGSLPAGILADRIGKRVVLVAGFVTYGLVYVGFAVANQVWHIWGLFAAYGLYSALTEGASRALVAELAPPDQKGTLLGLHAMLVGLGLLPASMITGILWQIFGPTVPFLVSGGIALATAVALAYVLRNFDTQ